MSPSRRATVLAAGLLAVAGGGALDTGASAQAAYAVESTAELTAEPGSEALAEAAEPGSRAPADSTQDLRPLRRQVQELPELEHHAGPERHALALPYGEPQFERFRAAYRTKGGQAWLEAVYERSRPFASYIYERIRYYGVPEELFFLPFIESEYSTKAVSKSGAMGLWQFMRNSIGGYGMRIDDWVDERRDFMKSTDGALRKLRDNYDRFGDWNLALAAYNCGAGAMDRAIKAGKTHDYWELRRKGLLPAETASYIPKFLAVVSVAMHGGRNGLTTSWTPSLDWTTVPVQRPVELGMLAAASGVSLEALRLGNPELRYGVTPPEGRYALKVPRADAPAIRNALESRDRLMNVYVHTVSSGDTVSALAKHYGVPVAMIGQLNPGLDPDRIRIGQRLAIPAFKDASPYRPERGGGDSLSFTGSYSVAKGDTLWSISLRYGVQPEVLAERNGLRIESVLREGTSLLVPILE